MSWYILWIRRRMEDKLLIKYSLEAGVPQGSVSRLISLRFIGDAQWECGCRGRGRRAAAHDARRDGREAAAAHRDLVGRGGRHASRAPHALQAALQRQRRLRLRLGASPPTLSLLPNLLSLFTHLFSLSTHLYFSPSLFLSLFTHIYSLFSPTFSPSISFHSPLSPPSFFPTFFLFLYHPIFLLSLSLYLLPFSLSLSSFSSSSFSNNRLYSVSSLVIPKVVHVPWGPCKTLRGCC